MPTGMDERGARWAACAVSLRRRRRLREQVDGVPGEKVGVVLMSNCEYAPMDLAEAGLLMAAGVKFSTV